jgi:hypothetical protein
MVEEALWRLGAVLFILSFTFVAAFWVSFYMYRVTDGRIYQVFVKRPKRFILTAFALSLVYGCGGVIVDLFNLTLAPIMVNPVNTNNVVVLGTAQFLLILISGGLVAWLSFRLGIPSAHKRFHRHD